MRVVQADIFGGLVDVTPDRPTAKPTPARVAPAPTLFDGDAGQFAGQGVAVDFTCTTPAGPDAVAAVCEPAPAAPAPTPRKCLDCPRMLTHPDSIRVGRGRVCQARHLGGGAPAPRPVVETLATVAARLGCDVVDAHLVDGLL